MPVKVQDFIDTQVKFLGWHQWYLVLHTRSCFTIWKTCLHLRDSVLYILIYYSKRVPRNPITIHILKSHPKHGSRAIEGTDTIHLNSSLITIYTSVIIFIW